MGLDRRTWYQKCGDCDGQSFSFYTAENGRWRTKLCDMCDARGWVDKVTPEMGKIIGGLAAFAINMVMDERNDENMGCCPLCCAPCVSLKRLQEIGAPVGNWVNLASGQEWGDTDGLYSWQLPNGDVNWDMVTERWDMVDCHEGMEDGDQLGAADHGAVSGSGSGSAAAGGVEPVH